MTIRLREKGQITLPSRIREQLKLSKDAPLSVAKIGDAILIAPQASRFEAAARKFESHAKRGGITLSDLLRDLRKIRQREP